VTVVERHRRSHHRLLNLEEVQDDLVRDVTEVPTLICAHLRGRQLACRHADVAVQTTEGAA
jgi:predicted site-specific integrase-resolvase